MRLAVSEAESHRVRALFSKKKPDIASADASRDGSRAQEGACPPFCPVARPGPVRSLSNRSLIKLMHVESPAGNKRKPSSPDTVDLPRKEKKPKEDAGSRGRPVPGPLPTASAKNSEQGRIADSELEAKSVELLVLDQIIPKKAKDGAARLFGKTAQGSSVVVSISGFRVSVGAKGEGGG